MNDHLGDFLGIALLILLIMLFAAGAMLAIPLGIGGGIAYGVWYYHNGPPAKKKRIEAETAELYKKALEASPVTETEFIERLESAVLDDRLVEVAVALYREEGFVTPPPPPPNLTSIEGGKYRDELDKFLAVGHSREKSERFTNRVIDIFRPLDDRSEGGLFKASRPRTNEEIERLIVSFFEGNEFFEKLRGTLDKNFNEQNAVHPSEYKGKNCPWDYLKDTPLLLLEYTNTSTKWLNPENHTLVLAGSGAGKTTLFKHLIAHLLKQDVCVIVMDSQSQLIEELAHVDLDDGALTWISPENPLALNPFHADQKDLKDEAYVNNAVGQLAFVIDKLLDAEMVPRQRTLFQHCTNLVLSIPGGNIDTFHKVLDDPLQFASDIDRLDKTTREFFFEKLQTNPKNKKGVNYDGTKAELAYRLDALLRNPTLRRIFNTKENRFNLFQQMLDKKLVLIDTSHARLAEDSATFGRFMIAQALQACYRRVKEKKTDRPVVLFIDEAHEYFDAKLEMMLLQARKANVGMVIATQDLSRASKAGISDSMIGSTTTKIVSRVVSGDAKRLASSMKTTDGFLLGLEGHNFAFRSGNQETVSIQASPTILDELPQRDDLESLRRQMTERYGPQDQGYEDDDPGPEPVSDPPSGPNNNGGSGKDRKMNRNDTQDIEPSDTL